MYSLYTKLIKLCQMCQVATVALNKTGQGSTTSSKQITQNAVIAIKTMFPLFHVPQITCTISHL